MNRESIVIGNWKMNGSLKSNAVLVSELLTLMKENKPNIHVAVCPPFAYLAQVSELIQDTSIGLGAQTLSALESGAHTGEISADMLLDIHCEYVLVGHSERRAMYHESNQDMAEKTIAAINKGLKVVLCVGETQAEYDANKTNEVISDQLLAVIDKLSDSQLASLIIAYEPVWAIGTGKTATPEIAQNVHRYIRELISKKSQPISEKIMILYGGSVKPDNAAILFNQPDIDGGLIGGASLNAHDFFSICRAI